MSNPAVWRIQRVEHALKKVWISDESEGHPYAMSVTNDAERVVADVHGRCPDYRIFYRDTMGLWDELLHEHGKFYGYTPGEPPP